jgi:flagellar protein FliS
MRRRTVFRPQMKTHSGGYRGRVILAYKTELSTYRETRIKTAGQGQLILMLYDEAVRQLDRALEYMSLNDTGKKDPSRIEKISKSLVKTQEIVSELMVSLDFDEGGEIAKNLFSLYTWFNRELLEAGIRQESRRILAVRNSLDALRSAWQEISSAFAETTNRGEIVGVDIAM